MNGGAGLQMHRSAVFPPDNRAPLSVHKSFLENVVKDILEIEQVRSIADINKLGGDLLMRTGRVMVGDPELSRLGLGAEG